MTLKFTKLLTLTALGMVCSFCAVAQPRLTGRLLLEKTAKRFGSCCY
jgi:hypothetical protein